MICERCKVEPIEPHSKNTICWTCMYEETGSPFGPPNEDDKAGLNRGQP